MKTLPTATAETARRSYEETGDPWAYLRNRTHSRSREAVLEARRIARQIRLAEAAAEEQARERAAMERELKAAMRHETRFGAGVYRIGRGVITREDYEGVRLTYGIVGRLTATHLERANYSLSTDGYWRPADAIAASSIHETLVEDVIPF